VIADGHPGRRRRKDGGQTNDQLEERLPGAAADDRVVVRWHQRGHFPAGLGFDGQVLGLYEVRQERLARAQMFYFDTDAVNRFLADVVGQRATNRPSGPPAPDR
jgi:hypothetical protein